MGRWDDGEWGSGEMGEWGHGAISINTPKPQNPKTLSPQPF
jgi:hypothetical protein